MTEQQVMRQALEALEHIDYEDNDRDFLFPYQCTMLDNAITALRQALEQQPAGEPVAWGIANTRPTERNPLMMVMLYEPAPSHLVVPLYTRPQPAAWVGLTDEEINSVRYKRDWTAPWTDKTFARAIEAKLKEKNAHG